MCKSDSVLGSDTERQVARLKGEQNSQSPDPGGENF